MDFLFPYQTGFTGLPWRDSRGISCFIRKPGLGQGLSGYFLPFQKKGKKSNPSSREGPVLRCSETVKATFDNKQRITSAGGGLFTL